MMMLVKFGGMAALGFTDAFSAPWWLALIVQIWTKIQNIREAGLYDIDKLAAPAEFWLDDEQLEVWNKERDVLREERSRR